MNFSSSNFITKICCKTVKDKAERYNIYNDNLYISLRIRKCFFSFFKNVHNWFENCFSPNCCPKYVLAGAAFLNLVKFRFQ